MRFLPPHALCLLVLAGACNDTSFTAPEALVAESTYRLAPSSMDPTVFVEPDRIDILQSDDLNATNLTKYRVNGAVNGLTYLTDPSAIAVALSREVVVLDTVSGMERFRFHRCHSCNSVRISRSADGREILMPGNSRDTGAAYDAETGDWLRDLTGPDYRLAYAPDNSVFLSVFDGEAVIETPTSGEIVWKSGIRRVGAVSYAPDGSHFAISADDDPKRGGKVLIYDASTRKVSARINYGRASFNHLAFAPDSNRLVMGSYKDRILVWDIEKRAVHCRMDSDRNGRGLRTLALSSNGRLIATGGGTDTWGYARIWDAETCALRTEVNFEKRVGSLSFHHAEPLLAAGAWSGEVAVINLEELK